MRRLSRKLDNSSHFNWHRASNRLHSLRNPMRRTEQCLLRLLALAPLALGLSGCVTIAAAPTAAGTTAAAPKPAAAASAAVAAASPGAAASRPASAAAAASAPTPGQPPAFAVVIKDAKRSDGLIPVWRKDEKLWLEIAPARLDQPLMFSVNISNSVGERGLHASTMGPNWLASFVKTTPTQIQLQALNAEHIATGAAQQHALAQSFSRSLLASMPIASAAHPESKAVLVDAAFLLADIPSYSRRLEAAFRLPYAPDRGNSHVVEAYATPDMTTVSTNMHFAISRLPLPPTTPSPGPQPSPPTALPDARSMFIGYVYNFVKMPETVMRPRVADGRIGHFFDSVRDFSHDRNAHQRVHYINRWRLEKKDPSAAMSEPVKPITFWLDKNIPAEYRETVRAGVLEWNKAFEKIGFKNAVLAEQQPDNATWDTLDGAHASVRWFFGLDSSTAAGPSHSDPRSGEILDADIKIGDGWGRGLRLEIVEQVGAGRSNDHAGHASRHLTGQPGMKDAHAYCSYAEEAMAESQFALESLYAMGEITPDSPEAEAFVQGVLKHVVMHEVGHALGLKHNFKASTVYTAAQLRNPAFTEANGLANSVMDYSAINLPLPGETRAALFDRTIGPYDEWAIEYAYRPLDAKSEAAELERIASRSTEPLLAFADDADAGGGPGSDGIDPLANRFDLGSDPLAYFERRLQLTSELWRRAQDWRARPGEGAVRQRRMLAVGFGQLHISADLVSKYVGGMHTTREVPGTPGAAGRQASFVPVDPEQQRRALDFLAKGLFSADSFRFSPQFIANLAPDFVEFRGRSPVSISASVLRVQNAALDRLMSGGTATRLLDLPLYLADAGKAKQISLSDVYSTLQGAVWSELKRGGEIDPLRRNLQREHLRRVQSALVRSSTPLPPDAMSLLRLHANRLQAELRVAEKRKGLSIETQAHLKDSLDSLTEALRATMQRG